MTKQTQSSLKMPEETCVICEKDLSGIGVRRGFTAALIFGNKSRDPHVGPYCKDCGPPAIAKTDQCVKDCPMTGEKWTPVDGHCITKHPKQYPYETAKCKFSLGRSPIRHGAISCIHPARMKKKRKVER